MLNCRIRQRLVCTALAHCSGQSRRAFVTGTPLLIPCRGDDDQWVRDLESEREGHRRQREELTRVKQESKTYEALACRMGHMLSMCTRAPPLSAEKEAEVKKLLETYAAHRAAEVRGFEHNRVKTLLLALSSCAEYASAVEQDKGRLSDSTQALMELNTAYDAITDAELLNRHAPSISTFTDATQTAQQRLAAFLTRTEVIRDKITDVLKKY